MYVQKEQAYHEIFGTGFSTKSFDFVEVNDLIWEHTHEISRIETRPLLQVSYSSYVGVTCSCAKRPHAKGC
jgi:hypothetical protein